MRISDKVEYNAILVRKLTVDWAKLTWLGQQEVREALHRSGIDWSSAWSEVPAREKADLYEYVSGELANHQSQNSLSTGQE